MNICVIGTGYVGLVTGTCLAEFGMNLTCVDKDETKIQLLSKGKVPIYEPGLEDLLKKNIKEGRISFSTNLKEAVKKSLVIFITVGTPSNSNGGADLKYIKEVAEEIGSYIDSYKVIVIKSTVPVGTGQKVKKWIKANLKTPVSFDLVSNPEFQREGSAINDFMRPDRVTIGAESEQAIAIMKDIYSALYINETPFIITNIETAEMIKYASNAFLALKISYINEIANLCEKMGADVHHVARAMGLDGRIGRKFLHPGPGFGGSCFPKDTKALSFIAKEIGEKTEIVDALIRVNENQKKRMITKIKNMVGDLKDKTIAILGLSFKPNTNDMREAPSITIIKGLLELGANIKATDPAAIENAKEILPNIKYFKDPYKAIEGADAVVLITEWNQYRRMDLEKIKSLLRKPIFIDLRNVYEPEKMRGMGFKYCGVGR